MTNLCNYFWYHADLADDPDESDELRDPQNPPEFIQIDEFGEAFEHAVSLVSILV